jgi:hypothetical protein
MLNLLLGLLSLVSIGPAVRDFKRIYLEDDRQPWLYVRLTSFAVITFAPYFLPEYWKNWTVLMGVAAVTHATKIGSTSESWRRGPAATPAIWAAVLAA